MLNLKSIMSPRYSVLVMCFAMLICLSANSQTIEQLEEQLKLNNFPAQDREMKGKLSGLYYKLGSKLNKEKKYLSAIQALGRSRSLSHELHNLRGEAQAFNLIGNVYQSLSAYDSAELAYLNSIELLKGTNFKKSLALAYNNLGIVYRKQGKETLAISALSSSLEIKEDLGEKKLGTAFTNIAKAYIQQGDSKKSEAYLERAIRSFEKENDYQKSDEVRLSLAQLFIDNKDFKRGRKELEKARDGFAYRGNNRRATTIDSLINLFDKDQARLLKLLRAKDSLELGSTNSEVQNDTLIALSKREERRQRRIEKSIEKMKERNPDLQEEITSLLFMSSSRNDLKEKLKNFRENLPKQGEEVVEAISKIEKENKNALSSGDVGRVLENYAKAEMIYEDQGDYQRALEFAKRRGSLLDSIDQYKEKLREEINNRQLVALQSEADQQKQQRSFIWVSSLLVLVSGFFYYRFNTKKKANTELAGMNLSLVREKARSDELLLNILPASTAEELKKNGKAAARKHDNVSVLFADFKGFTKIAEELEPEDLVNELDKCFRAFDSITSKHNVEKIKTIGDAYMCVGGIPKKDNDNAVNTVNAALDIQEFMANLKKENEKQNIPVFEARIGIHTGPVIAGVVGIKKFAYDVWGDTVNTASRMESSGEAGRINISGDTYQIVKDFYECEHRGKLQAKSKGLVDMYFVNKKGTS